MAKHRALGSDGDIGVAVAIPALMEQTASPSDQLENRLVEFAAQIIGFAPELPETPAG